MMSLNPAFIMIVGAFIISVLPARYRSSGFLGIALVSLIITATLPAQVSGVFEFMGHSVTLLRVDRLSRLFGMIMSLITLIGGIYAFHLKDPVQQIAALLYAGGAIGVIFVGDLLSLYVFWELMAISSVILIWSRRSPESDRAGWRYIMVHLFGGAVLLAGILIHVQEVGHISFAAFSPQEPNLGSVLILTGVILNAAVPPLHAWLADGYPKATVTGGVFLSALTTKTAVYVLLRGFAGWEILIPLGVIMAVYGVVYAVLANDIRELLAYHIISQVGYMVCGVGIGTELALNGAAAHAVCHILYKGLLFMGAGAVLQATAKSKLTELGGLINKQFLIFSLYMIGAFSISGFPLFNGFISKSMVIMGADDAGLTWAYLLLTLASVGTFLHTGLKLPYFTWLGPQRNISPKPVPKNMLIAMGIAAFFCFFLGILPGTLYRLLPFVTDFHPYTAAHIMESVQILVFTGIAFYFFIPKLGGEATISLDTDWFYRQGGRLFYRLMDKTLNGINARSDQFFVRNLAARLGRWSRVPVSSLVTFYMKAMGSKEVDIKYFGEGTKPETDNLIPMGVTVFLSFIGLLFLFIVLTRGA